MRILILDRRADECYEMLMAEGLKHKKKPSGFFDLMRVIRPESGEETGRFLRPAEGHQS